jgi:hypothetical protein
MTSANMLTRIGRLEGIVVRHQPKGHRLIGASAAECEVQRRALIDRGQAGESDFFIHRILVSPAPRVQ